MDIINPNEDTRIAKGSQVLLHFSVSLEDGTELDNSRRFTDPVSLVIGDGSFLEGFEQMVIGLRAGDRRSSVMLPEQAFGEWNADNVQKFDRVKFEKDLAIGSVVEFEDKGKNTLAGVVKEISDHQVEVDFNHPLAGKSVVFEVEIFKITPATMQKVQFF